MSAPDLFSLNRNPYGATSEETERATGRPHKSVSGRFSELRMLELIDYAYESPAHRQRGERMRRKTESGCSAFVHVATDLGRRVAALGLPIRIRGGADITSNKHHNNEMSRAAHAQSDYSSLRLIVLQNVVKHS